MNCKCGKPVEKAIEGEIICENCWSWGQMSAEDRESVKIQIWFENHCAGCEKKCKPNENGLCTNCQAEFEKELMERILE